MTGARQDMPGYDRYIASHDKYMACTYYYFLKCVFITFESSISCSSHVLCMLAYSNIRKLSPSMKTWWWHYSYIPVIYLDIPLYTVIWRYMRVYVGISGCQDSRWIADIVSSLYPISCHIFRCREYCTRYRARCLEILPARGPAVLAFRLLAPVRNR